MIGVASTRAPALEAAPEQRQHIGQQIEGAEKIAPMVIDRLAGERAYLSSKNRHFLNFFRSVNQFTHPDDSLR
jgi:hypothetical protein